MFKKRFKNNIFHQNQPLCLHELFLNSPSMNSKSMCTFLVVDSAGEWPCHVLARLAESSPLQPPWLEILCSEAAKSIEGWSQEGKDVSTLETETLLVLHGLSKQWVESGLNQHLELKMLMEE